eukprot:7389191-Prymnesium_polylepis.2
MDTEAQNRTYPKKVLGFPRPNVSPRLATVLVKNEAKTESCECHKQLPPGNKDHAIKGTL